MTNKDKFSTLLGQDIEPIKKSGRTHHQPVAKVDTHSLAARREAAITQPETLAALGDEGFELLGSEQSLSYSRPGLDKASLKRLTHGHLRPSITIDLHGHDLDRARALVWRALREAQIHKDRCILIVHGKAGTGYRDDKGDLQDTGKALIKSHVNHWLQQVEEVLAFCSAQPRDGGTGAIYVLLRNKAKQKKR